MDLFCRDATHGVYATAIACTALPYQRHIAGFVEHSTCSGNGFDLVHINIVWLRLIVIGAVPPCADVAGGEYKIAPAVVDAEVVKRCLTPE